MKINKNKTILAEAVEATTVPAVDSVVDNQEELEERKIEIELPDDFDLDDASRGDLARAIKAGMEKEVASGNAAPEDTLSKAEIQQNASDAFKAADLIENPYGATNTSEIEKKLQTALDVALANRRVGAEDLLDYPNVLLYGMAGFGKTAVVKQFCKDHHINLFECDAKSLDLATVGGIPYPVKDKNGKWTQRPIASSYWDALFEDNTVLFLDEFNRAATNIQGSLLGLINNHILPISQEGADGKVTNKHKFNNILFTVSAINPASSSFSDVNEFTPEKVSRHPIIHEVVPDATELLNHLNRVYTTVLKNPMLPETDRYRYAGQQAIMQKILTDPDFHFNSREDVEQINTENNTEGTMHNPLNYRTFFGNLLLCTDGTKATYLEKLSYSRFTDEIVEMFKDILTDYVDLPKKGNTIFDKAAQQAAAQATAAQQAAASTQTAEILNDFFDDIDDSEDDDE